MYDPRIGQFLSADPIEDDKENTRRYVGNSPTNATDPTGLTPNRLDAMRVDDLVNYVRAIEKQYPDASPAEILVHIRDAIKGDRKLSGGGGSAGSGSRSKSESASDSPANDGGYFIWGYIYTQDAGWIDLGHFFESARYAKSPILPKTVVASGGIGVEILQGLVGEFAPMLPGRGSSAFTAEDLASNWQGARFGDLVSETDCNTPLSKQLELFFDSLGAKDPTLAPDYKTLPATEGEHEQAWQERVGRERYERATITVQGGVKSHFPCFPAGTLVHCPDRLTEIASIRNGDIVIAYDPVSHSCVHTLVRQVLVHADSRYDILELSTFDNNSIRVTPHHPFYDGERWRLAEDYEGSGKNVTLRDGIAPMKVVQRFPERERRVYNLVTDAGSFLVGTAGFVASGMVESPRTP